MNNFYMESDFKYNEIVIALEDYYSGSKVKFYLPTLMTFLDSSKVYNETKKINTSNIMNKNKTNLNINTCTSCNYVDIFLPRSLSYNKATEYNPHDGRKGDRFVVSFVGGDINKLTIIGRLD